ncbi:hypothetical protein C8R44DRAFT_890480 [Mycena epipterygia]|nr:hypothetical protein C8R44DRAFT_890480 [Mycena epipterygia]
MDVHRRLSSLRKLSLLDVRSVEDLMRPLQNADFHPTLEHLKLSFAAVAIPAAPLPAFSALRVFEIEFPIRSASLPSALDDLLANLTTTAPLLESLLLNARLKTTDVSSPEESEPYPLFASLDFVRQLPRLREVSCFLNMGLHMETSFSQYIERKFPGPMEGGILTVGVLTARETDP